MKYLSILILASCADPYKSLDREYFENEWWRLKEYPVCINFHESGDLLSYQEQRLEDGEWGQFLEEGKWIFYEPNEYFVEDRVISIFESEECWQVDGFFDNRPAIACECDIF